MTPKEHTPNADKSAQSFEIRTEYLRSILKATPPGQYPDKVWQSAWGLVKMTYDERSDFRRIKNLIKRNEIDQAVEIIKNMGTSGKCRDHDKIFLAYVCSLGEIVLLNIIDRKKSKEAVEKILEHLQSQFSSKIAVLFNGDSPLALSDYLMFLLVVELTKMGIDAGLIYSYFNVNDYKCDWLEHQGPYNDVQADVLFDSFTRSSISRPFNNKNRSLLAKVLKEQGYKRLGGEPIEYYLKGYYFADKYLKESWQDFLGVSFKGGEWLNNLEIKDLDSPYLPFRITTLASVANVYVLNGRYPEARKFLQEAVQLLPNAYDDKKDEVLELLSFVYCRLGDLALAISLARQIACQEEKGYALEEICFAFYKYNKQKKSGNQKTKENSRDEARIKDSYTKSNSHAETIAAGNIVESINNMLNEKLLWVDNLSDRNKKSAKLAEMAVMFSIIGKYDKALELSSSITLSTLQKKTFFDIGEVMVENGYHKKAMEFLGELHSRALKTSDKSGRDDLLKKIVVLYARSGESPKAINCCKDLSGPLERNDAILAVCEILIFSNRKDEALALLHQVNCTNPIINEAGDTKYFLKWLLMSKLVDLFYKCGQYKDAVSAFRQIPDPFVKKITSVRNAQLAAFEGKIEEALAFTSPLIEPTIGEDIDIDRQKELSYLAIQLAYTGRREDCLYVYDLIPDRDKDLPVELVRSFLSNADITGAMAIAGKIRHDGLIALTLAVIAAFHVRNNQPDKAKNILQQAMDLIDKANKDKAGPMDEAIIEVVSVLCLINQIPEATKIIKNFAGKEMPDSSFFLRLTEKLELNHLQEIINRMNENNANPILRGALAIKLARAGLWKDAIELEEKHDLINSMNAYLTYIDLLVEKGKVDHAIALTEKLKDPFSKNNAWCTLARSLAQRGETDKAIKALEQFNYREDIVLNEKGKHLAMAVIGYALIINREKDRAEAFIKMFSSDFFTSCREDEIIPFFELETDYLINMAEKKPFQSNQLFCFADNKDIINRLRVYSGRRIAERKGLDFAFMVAARIANHDERILFKQAIIDHHIRSVYTLDDALSLVKHITDSTELMEYLLTIAVIREIFQGSMKDPLPESFRESIHLQWAGNVTKGFRKPM